MKMKTYVVNMEKDTQKRELITNQLKQHTELDWQIWKAVEGRKLSKEEQKEMIRPEFYEKYKTNATLPAVGCSLSHFHIYKDIISKSIPYALILEDDALLSDNLHLEELSKYLDTTEPVVILLSPRFWYWKKDKQEDISDKHSVFRLSTGLMTSGYLINNAAAGLLADIVYPIQYMADAWGDFVKKGLNLYGVVPHLTSYPKGIGEIGRSQHKQSLYIKIRKPLIDIYLALLRCKRYMKGEKRAKRLW